MSPVDEYLAALDSAERAELERVREIIHAAVPGLEETISYGMPTFRYNGKQLLGIAAYKDHLSIFPGAHAVAALARELSDRKTAKGTVQFTVDSPLPEPLIQAMVRLRLEAIGQ